MGGEGIPSTKRAVVQPTTVDVCSTWRLAEGCSWMSLNGRGTFERGWESSEDVRELFTLLHGTWAVGEWVAFT